MLYWHQRALSVPRKYPLHQCTTTTSLNHQYKAGWSFHDVYVKLDHLDVAAENKTHHTREHFFQSIVQFCWQEEHHATRCVFFCCCSPSASRFDVCVQRCSSAYLGCNEWLFDLQLPFYQLKPVCPWSDINKVFSSTNLPLTGYSFLSLLDHSQS